MTSILYNNPMTKKKPTPKAKAQPAKRPVPAKTPRTLTLVLAIIASVLVTIVLYALYVAFVDYLETANPDVGLFWLAAFLFAVVLGPGIVVAAIIYPRLKK